MAAKILPLLPSHKQYCEPFFGGGSIFFAKQPCPRETINDLDEGVTTFFRVLRDRGEEFIRRAQLTEYGEALWRDCWRTWQAEENELLRAWKWWVVARQSFSGHFGHSQGHTRTAARRWMPENVSKFLSAIDALPLVVERLRRTQILCGDWERAMRITDTPDCLTYCDPPYMASTRSSGQYACEMSDADHDRLLGYLLSGEAQGMVVLGGYPNPLYERLDEAGWRRVDFQTACHAAARTRESELLGKGAALAKQPRTESVWLCPRTQRTAGSLFNQQPAAQASTY
jgi:DNA adenine methylase